MSRIGMMLAGLSAAALLAAGLPAQGEKKETAPTLVERIDQAIVKASAALQRHQDAESGAFSFGQPYAAASRHPGITGIAMIALQRSPRAPSLADAPTLRKALDWLASLQKEDGAIFEKDTATYVTSLALVALAESKDETYRPVIEKARDWLVRQQSREDNGFKPGDKFYGGIGYGDKERPDVSNGQFAIEAIKAAGLATDDPFWARMVKFLQRNQNWSESNDQVWSDDKGEIKPGNDGGAMYRPGESKAGIEVRADGSRILRSYGSMSYALLKSYLFCNLDRNDARVRAVHRWCAENFDLEKHPGFQKGEKGTEEYQGLFYYYYSMAKCLSALGQRQLEQESGLSHDWPVELAEKLLSLQNPEDGSFVNGQNSRWQENAPVLCTSYAVLALEECRRQLTR